MWVKNKTTGLIWEVTGELAERLSRSPEYEEVEPPCLKSEPTATSTSQEQTEKTIQAQTAEQKETTAWEDMTYNELKAAAKEAGIPGYSRMTKDQLIKALKG